MTDTEKIAIQSETPEASVNPVADGAATAITDAATAASVEEPVEKDSKAETEMNVHQMSKEQILETLRDIVARQDVAAHKLVTSLKQALFNVRQKEINLELDAFVEAGNAPEDFSANPDEAENEGKELVAKFKEMRTQYLEEERIRLEKNLEKKREIISEMQAIVDDADNINMQFPKFKELQQSFRDIKEVTPSEEAEIWKKFQEVIERFYDTLKINKELRDLDFKKNLEAKTRLLERAKALTEEEDVQSATRQLGQLMAEWREIGPVVKELRDSIWEEFKTASSIIYRKHQDFHDQRKAEEKKNEESKTALCEEIEKIDFNAFTRTSEWDAAATAIKELQAKWKTLGFASRKANNELYARFRKTCDDFFTARGAYVKNHRETIQANIAKKEELCASAEAVMEISELSEMIKKISGLQKEWRTIGVVPRKIGDELWQRFNGACNKVYALRKEADSARRGEEVANLEAKREIVAKLKEIPLDIDRRAGLAKVKELQAQWNAIGFVPIKSKEKLQKEYREVCDALYGSFQASRKKESRRHFEAQISDMKGDDRKLRSERDRLLRVIEQKSQELKTYANNLGFFNVKSAAGNSMLKEMERKMGRIEEDIKQIREKVAMLDQASEKSED